MQDTDPGKLPPRTRAIYSEVGLAIGQGWRPGELAAKLGVAPSWLSELLAELRTALGLLHGIFPTLSDDQYRALLASVAAHGVQVPIVVDERGIIDGYARVRAVEELAELCRLAEALPMWAEIAGDDDRNHQVELHGRDIVEQAEQIAGYGPGLVFRALERRWQNPPIDRRVGLTDVERRELAVSLNAQRRHLDRGQIRQVVEAELMLNPFRSNVVIGELAGCSHQWVAQVRAQLEEDEKRLANPQPEDEVQVLEPWRPVAQLDCPHCHHHVAVLRAGKEFKLEELPAGDPT